MFDDTQPSLSPAGEASTSAKATEDKSAGKPLSGKVILYKNMGPVVSTSPHPPAGGRRGAGEVHKQEPKISYPAYSPASPLQAELEAFIRCIKTGKKPLSDLAQGVAVVRVLAAAEKSMNLDGRKVKL